MPASSNRAIALVGFMAAGKTRAGAAIARALGEELVDTDALIEDRIGEPVAVFFDREGEAAFRAIEEEVTVTALGAGGVVALGGGAVASERVREALAEHVCVWCRVREEVAWDRARGGGRPLARDRDAFSRLFAEREPLYREVGRVVLPRGGDQTPAAAASWLAALRGAPELRMAWARAGGSEYPVLVGPRAGAALSLAGAPSLGERGFAIADPAAIAAASAALDGIETTIETPGGETAKTLERAERVLVRMAAAGVRRDDFVVAVGGGVVGDLAGFCAAVYQRGVPVVQVPTTLVAQVDSALGGKTGVDLEAAKNYVGAYHQPAAVLADPGALASLPQQELAAGFSEVVKTALIAGGDLWERTRAISAPTLAAVEPLIFDCALTKLAVVAEDERDSGRRAVLNLGHTIGHAIEAATAYERYRHGEAVALGLLCALRLSEQPELAAEVAELFALWGLPRELDAAVDPDQVVAATERDKKRTAAGLGFVLVRAPGEIEHGVPVDEREVRAAVRELLP